MLHSLSLANTSYFGLELLNVIRSAGVTIFLITRYFGLLFDLFLDFINSITSHNYCVSKSTSLSDLGNYSHLLFGCNMMLLYFEFNVC